MTTYQQYQKLYPRLFSNQGAYIRVCLNPDHIQSWQINQSECLLKEGRAPSEAEIGVVYQDKYITLLRDLVEYPDGSHGSYLRLLNTAQNPDGQGVVVLCVYNGKILLMRQYRHPVRAYSWEFPRGFAEPGSTSQQQARTEVLEEVQGVIDQLVPLGAYHSNTGLDGNSTQLFLATLTQVGCGNTREGILELRWVNPTEIEQLIATSQVMDGFTIAAYTRAKLNGLLDTLT